MQLLWLLVLPVLRVQLLPLQVATLWFLWSLLLALMAWSAGPLLLPGPC